MTIFLKSSCLISFPSPTVFRKSCSNFSNEVLSKPVFARLLVKLEMHSIMCVVATEFVPSTSIHDLLHHISNYSSQDQCHTHRSADRIYQLSIKGVHTNEIICVYGKNLVILHFVTQLLTPLAFHI